MVRGKYCIGKKGETGGKVAVNFQCCLLHAIIFGWKPDSLLRNKENWSKEAFTEKLFVTDGKLERMR